MFIKNEKEIIQAIIEFNDKPELWRTALGSAPKYFVHFKENEVHKFGLSKFCAIYNICVESYIKEFRNSTDGETTQKHISKVTKKDWVPISETEKDIQIAFTAWIKEFFSNYNINNASIISLNFKNSFIRKHKQLVSPVSLQNSLFTQKQIGNIGEEIAIKYEVNRLNEIGINKPEQFVDHISKKNISSGYDIHSFAKNEVRYIEVKSSLNDSLDFFITENEVQMLENLEKEAYIYFVYITNLVLKEGKVLNIMNNPIAQLKRDGLLKPIAFKVELINK